MTAGHAAGGVLMAELAEDMLDAAAAVLRHGMAEKHTGEYLTMMTQFCKLGCAPEKGRYATLSKSQIKACFEALSKGDSSVLRVAAEGQTACSCAGRRVGCE